MTVTTTCPKCQKPRRVDLGDVDGPLADALARFAGHSVCDACAGPEVAQNRSVVHNCGHHRPTTPRREVRLPYAD